jgi:hypothetical protein
VAWQGLQKRFVALRQKAMGACLHKQLGPQGRSGLQALLAPVARNALVVA